MVNVRPLPLFVVILMFLSPIHGLYAMNYIESFAKTALQATCDPQGLPALGAYIYQATLKSMNTLQQRANEERAKYADQAKKDNICEDDFKKKSKEAHEKKLAHAEKCSICLDTFFYNTEICATTPQTSGSCSCTKQRIYHPHCFDAIMRMKPLRCPHCKKSWPKRPPSEMKKYGNINKDAPYEECGISEQDEEIFNINPHQTSAQEINQIAQGGYNYAIDRYIYPSMPMLNDTRKPSNIDPFDPTEQLPQQMPYYPAPPMPRPRYRTSTTIFISPAQQELINIQADMELFRQASNTLFLELDSLEKTLIQPGCNIIATEERLMNCCKELLNTQEQHGINIKERYDKIYLNHAIDEALHSLREKGNRIYVSIQSHKAQIQLQHEVVQKALQQAYFLGQQEAQQKINLQRQKEERVTCGICSHELYEKQLAIAITHERCPRISPLEKPKIYHEHCFQSMQKIAPGSCPSCRSAH